MKQAMRKRVEFIGPMGAGKSVICSDLIKGNSYSLECAKSAKRKIILDEVKKKSRAYCYLTKGLLRRGHFFNVLIDKNITEIARSAMEENAKWRDFIELVMSQGFSNEAPCFEKVRRAERFIRDVTDLALLNEKAGPGRVIVHDESIAQRGVGLSLGFEAPLEFSKAYFESAPLPDVIVHVDCSNEELMEARIRNRDRSDMARHLGTIKKACEISRLGVKIMRGRGVMVIECDGEREISENADDIEMQVKRVKQG
ncbi:MULTISPECIES: hypothetical protein [Halorhodospira]|uniref:hypothetical protein n=1 Tax=Halorhodospira TaxID=85108 RepID=UPI001EE80E22|nr:MULTISPECIES: hypothetical protein [Halorhodospira]MCG5528003.1 hypothetical protein [Halorhodospira halophila]MCG5542127.1 hypothetical protein [Halorhodospira sp. 9628]